MLRSPDEKPRGRGGAVGMPRPAVQPSLGPEMVEPGWALRERESSEGGGGPSTVMEIDIFAVEEDEAEGAAVLALLGERGSRPSSAAEHIANLDTKTLRT